MIELTKELGRELKQAGGNILDVADPDSGQRYVIVKADIYERLKQLLSDDKDLTPDEQLRLLADSGQRAGWNDPAMDVYDNYDENRRNSCPCSAATLCWSRSPTHQEPQGKSVRFLSCLLTTTISGFKM
jgi:hypothetical protein